MKLVWPAGNNDERIGIGVGVVAAGLFEPEIAVSRQSQSPTINSIRGGLKW
jgi:hypothetical protein